MRIFYLRLDSSIGFLTNLFNFFDIFCCFSFSLDALLIALESFVCDFLLDCKFAVFVEVLNGVDMEFFFNDKWFDELLVVFSGVKKFCC